MGTLGGHRGGAICIVSLKVEGAAMKPHVEPRTGGRYESTGKIPGPRGYRIVGCRLMCSGALTIHDFL